ncbi:hypothetical protein Poli38472_005217 [Pythium oligandrum]|uniref:Uncharacterized protein n=1 Tax=Pythium oligandrum TaxID=41045 RepID=A0A8K1CGH3_PYTOL|nr:hypothetical protein Poli38472_005217 [Pythium oligandrum]|eukprot:TMW62599.1 hypothetical protein Poli38472_005217 [Pythium oligandrum]
MVKYIKLKDSDLDPETIHKIVEDVFARPVVYLTQYKNLANDELLLKEAELIAAAAIRGNTLQFLARAMATSGLSLLKSPFDTISRARGSMLMYRNLSHCRQELIRRGLQPQFPLKVSVSAGNAIIILSCTILRELPVPMLKKLIPDEAE